MARKKESVNMIETLAEFKDLKNINRETMTNVLEESFRSVIAKMFGTDENYDIIINPEKGDFEIWRNRTVVSDGQLVNTNLQVSLSEAREMDPDCEVGEDVTDEVYFEKFGRRAILNLRQTLASKILELQKDNLFARYKGLIGTVISAEVYQVWKKELLLLDDDGNDLLLPKSEQIPADFFRKGENVRAVIKEVTNDNNNPRIVLSRTHNMFLQRLFELEVPEINDGLITIKSIARVPGERAKIAVESYDDRIDPVGACVGMKGSRIRGIVHELRNENIDVINYTTNTSLFIQRAISPAKISSIRLNEADKSSEVFLRPEEVSLAIGKGGLNIKLACMLTGYKIDVFRDIDDADEEDIYLDEFSDEIDAWVIDALKALGCNTAKAVLALSPEDIMERADLEEQTVKDVYAILMAEFEDEYGYAEMDEQIPEEQEEQEAETPEINSDAEETETPTAIEAETPETNPEAEETETVTALEAETPEINSDAEETETSTAMEAETPETNPDAEETETLTALEVETPANEKE